MKTMKVQNVEIMCRKMEREAQACLRRKEALKKKIRSINREVTHLDVKRQGVLVTIENLRALFAPGFSPASTTGMMLKVLREVGKPMCPKELQEALRLRGKVVGPTTIRSCLYRGPFKSMGKPYWLPQ